MKKVLCCVCETVNKQLNAALTEGDSVYFGSLRVRQVFVHLLEDLLLHLRDAVTVQHLHGGDVRPLALDQHLQRLPAEHRKHCSVYELTKPFLIKQCHIKWLYVFISEVICEKRCIIIRNALLTLFP